MVAPSAWEEIHSRILGSMRGKIECLSDPELLMKERMDLFVHAAWPILKDQGASWIGFYKADCPPPGTTCLLLASREPKPACSPIGLHGACGQSFLSAKPMVVADVSHLGSSYIACDPRDRSELVVPCLDSGGTPWGVVDMDSFELGQFDAMDAQNVEKLLRAAKLSASS